MIIRVPCKIFNATYLIKKKNNKSRTPKCCSLLSKEYFLIVSVNYEFLIYFFKGYTGLDMI